jgi:RNA polymerase sigma-70 factor (ECF subfamily)
MNEQPDVEWLVRRAKNGDREAFSTLVKTFQAKVFSIALRISARAEDAQDITQETFLRAYRSLSGFDTGRKFESWLARITVHCAYDHIGERGQGGVSLDALFESNPGMWQVEAQDAGPEGLAQRRQRLEALFRGIQVLPARQRDAFVLKDLEGYETPDVAEILSCDEATVRRHLVEARKKLREILGDDFL